MVFTFDEIDLQLFAEGEGGAAGAGAGCTQDGAAQGEPEALPEHHHGRKPNPLQNVRYGLQPADNQSGQSSRDDAGKGAEASREEWEALKKGRFAKFYGDDVSSTVQQRLKNSKQAETSMEKLKPVLEQIAKKTGKSVDDVDGLVNAYMDDDSLYEDEALERGMSVNTLKSIKRLERNNEALKAKQAKEAQDQLFAQHMAGLEQQAQKLQQTVPGFNLQEALQDDRFRKMTSPEGGLDVESAYFALHHNEMMQGVAQAAIQRTKQAVSATIQSGRGRPSENGTTRQAPALDVRADPTKLSKQDREEIRRRVRMGEKIYW